MSDLAAGIPIGMSIGIGAGIGIGSKKAKKEIAQQIREMSSTHDIKIKKPDGQYLAIDDFINELGAGDSGKEEQNKTLIVTAIGILILLAGILAFFLIQ